MAEAILDNEVEHHPILEGQIKTESAGTFAFDEAEPTSYAKMVMEEMGLDIDKHEAKQVDEELVEWADLILTMDDSSLEQMEVMFPEETEKMHRLKEYVADDPNSEDVNYNISDPYGEDYDTYMECAKEN